VISYRVRIADANAHLVEVEIQGAQKLAMPAWSPGSYLVRDYARNVRDFEGIGGPARKLDKQTWEAKGDGLRYRVYAHEMTVRTSHVDAQHAFLHGPSVLMYAVGREREPCRIEIDVPSGWQLVTALPRECSGYDQLADTPIEMARSLLRAKFDAAGRPHEIAICGTPDAPVAPTVLAADVARIVEQAAAIFGGVPYEKYLFLLHLAGGSGAGGLEHRDSSALIASPYSFRPRKKYEELLELFSHEHFHVWNVKRIRPRALGPFDYTRENYTRSLWVMEGVTSYYDRHLLVRAGLLSPKRYLEKLGEELARLRQTPGRFAQSLEESSFDAWIKFYKPDEATPNATVSYYLKGSLVAMAIDLEVRSKSKRSLDDVMRLLWERYGRAPEGFHDDDVGSLFEEATGVDLGGLFGAHVKGRGELDLEKWLALAGLKVEAPEAEAGEPEGGWLGAQMREIAGRLTLASVLAGSPAERGGLCPNDEVVALDGFRVDDKALRERIASRAPGTRVRLSVFRREELVDVTVELGAKPPESYAIKPDPNASPEARALGNAWLGDKLES
jgi:predicted metalloprotease with PDZ domain